jgi:hypothetical protein
VLGDFDGDGRRDFAAYREWTGDWTVKLSSTNFTTTLSINWGGPGHKPVAADYDGDGKADFAVYTESACMDRARILVRPQVFCELHDRPVAIRRRFGPYGAYIPLAADFDGDGKADMGLYEKLTGIWWTKDSSQNFGSASASTGAASTRCSCRAITTATARPMRDSIFAAAARWYIAKSSTSYVEAIDVVLGGADATPVPDDYDGDGKTDPAVVRPASRRRRHLVGAPVVDELRERADSLRRLRRDDRHRRDRRDHSSLRPNAARRGRQRRPRHCRSHGLQPVDGHELGVTAVHGLHHDADDESRWHRLGPGARGLRRRRPRRPRTLRTVDGALVRRPVRRELHDHAVDQRRGARLEGRARRLRWRRQD